MNKYNQHLISDVPNNIVTRWVVRLVTRYMRSCNSRYELVMRYRSLRDGHPPRSRVSLKCSEARRFSIYITVRRCAQRAEALEREEQRLRWETRQRELTETLLKGGANNG